MNNVTPLYRRVLVIIFCILVISLAAHFLQDLQPGHLALQASDSASLSGVCHMAIHTGILGGIIPGIALMALAFSIVSSPPVFRHSGPRAILLPPPIRA